ncbi:MAG: hypothetical protein LBK03_03420 [Bacteroidales bacterium]|jgi:hypothetical protein|nr:hypothetical protein [Bacteroidales bacterium]
MNNELFNLLINKGELKQSVYDITSEAMQVFKEVAQELEDDFRKQHVVKHETITVQVDNKNHFETQIRFAGDVLILLMHTNIFEFPRAHQVMQSKYIREDKERSYCGMIKMYNFLSDSFKYNRINDEGYMIGRILINKDRHYFVEGKKELAQILNNFSENEFTKDVARNILHCAIRYCVNFDLLVPNFEETIKMTLSEMIQIEGQNMISKTAKRLGFRFEKDNPEVL